MWWYSNVWFYARWDYVQSCEVPGVCTLMRIQCIRNEHKNQKGCMLDHMYGTHGEWDCAL